MSLSKNIVVAAFLLGVFVLAYLSMQSGQVDASVMRASEYLGRNITATSASAYAIRANNVVTLGSVIVASSSPASMTIKNATSTTDSASTTVVTIPAEAPEGTYTFDIVLNRGLIVEYNGVMNGDIVVTFRP